MAFVNFLDLQTILVNTLAGSIMIFIALAIILIAIFAARFRMNNIMFFMMLTLFAVIFSTFIPWFYAFMILVAGLAIFYIIGRLIKT